MTKRLWSFGTLNLIMGKHLKRSNVEGFIPGGTCRGSFSEIIINILLCKGHVMLIPYPSQLNSLYSFPPLCPQSPSLVESLFSSWSSRIHVAIPAFCFLLSVYWLTHSKVNRLKCLIQPKIHSSGFQHSLKYPPPLSNFSLRISKWENKGQFLFWRVSCLSDCRISILKDTLFPPQVTQSKLSLTSRRDKISGWWRVECKNWWKP